MKRYLLLLSLVFLAACTAAEEPSNTFPNIILIITDDQGYGDIGFHGNSLIETPTLDRLAQESTELSYFYVSPVCAPTRASLMTGRYHHRTGVVDTYLGRAMMYGEETTIAEVLRDAGYATGIFGKWHLGDNFPLRAMDQGFQESLVHRGGGIGQPSDPPGNSYFDPILMKNGQDFETEGYCTDIFFEAAQEFIRENREGPFFAYIPTNAPHGPLEIGEEYVTPYIEKGLDDATAKTYGMITNIDENVDRLLRHLDELNLTTNTILIFTTDNGPQRDRYIAGLRGRKASVFEGGIRVPFLIRWPGVIGAGTKSDFPSAHIDILPTLLDSAHIPLPSEIQIDGISLLEELRNPGSLSAQRLLFFQAHRGDVPQWGRNCAVRDQNLKLVQPQGWRPGPLPEDLTWHLYDLSADPGEQNDLSEAMPEEVRRLKEAYDVWFQDVSSTRGYDPPNIALGSEFENPVILTRQDWRGPDASWDPDGLGYWEVEVLEAGNYQIRFRFPETETAGRAVLKIHDLVEAKAITRGDTSVIFDSLEIPAGEGRLEAILEFPTDSRGVHYVDVLKME